MSESVTKRMNAAPLSSGQARELTALMKSMQSDIAALATSLNQLITDYNANSTIATDTTAAAVTPNTTA